MALPGTQLAFGGAEILDPDQVRAGQRITLFADTTGFRSRPGGLAIIVRVFLVSIVVRNVLRIRAVSPAT